MRIVVSEKNRFKFIVAVSFALSIFSSLTAAHTGVAMISAIMETILLLYFAVFKKPESFTLYLLFIVSLSIESNLFAFGSREIVLYNIFNLPYLKIYLFLFILALADLRILQAAISSLNHMPGHSKIRKFANMFLIMCIVGLFMTCLTYLINDNNIFVNSGMFSFVARDIYHAFFTCTVLIHIIYFINQSNKNLNLLEECVCGMLVGVSMSAPVLLILGNYYTSGSSLYITCPLLLFFAPGLILKAFEKKHGFVCLVCGVISLLVQLFYTVGIAGAWWLYVMLIFASLFFRMLSIKKMPLIKIFLWMIFFIGLIGIAGKVFSPLSNSHVSYKFESITNMIKNRGGLYNWYLALNGSIRVRVEEIVNIFIEFVEKPWFIPFGKGYGGTILKHWGISNWNVSGSTFDDIQIAHQTFSTLHMGFAELMINFGFIGIAFVIYVIRLIVKEMFRSDGNAWILMGGFWLLFFYGCYYGFIVGLVWLIIGLYQKYGETAKF